MADQPTAGDDLETLNEIIADLRDIQGRFLCIEDKRMGVEHATELNMAIDAAQGAENRVAQLTQDGEWPPEE